MPYHLWNQVTSMYGMFTPSVVYLQSLSDIIYLFLFCYYSVPFVKFSTVLLNPHVHCLLYSYLCLVCTKRWDGILLLGESLSIWSQDWWFCVIYCSCGFISIFKIHSSLMTLCCIVTTPLSRVTLTLCKVGYGWRLSWMPGKRGRFCTNLTPQNIYFIVLLLLPLHQTHICCLFALCLSVSQQSQSLPTSSSVLHWHFIV